jgi:two-component system NarL family sensor kinase
VTVEGVVRRRRPTLILVWVALLGSVGLGALSVALRVGLPSDGARVGFYAGAWSADGVSIAPIDAPADGLRAGDRVTAVDGVSLGTWVGQVLRPDVERAAGTATYALERAGAAETVRVTWGRPSIAATLAEGWSLVVASVAIGGLGAWVLRRRPDTPAARALAIGGAGVAGSSLPWFLGVTVSDVVQGLPFVVQSLVTGPVYMLIWPATIHLALTFPTPVTALRRRPALAGVIYAVGFAAYAGLTLTAGLGRPTLEWIGLWPVTQLAVIVPAMALAIPVFVVRAIRAAEPAERARHRLATLGLIGTLALGLVTFMGPALLTGRPLIPDSAVGLVVLPLPFLLGYAIVHDRLFDLDVAIRRTLVYGGLTVGVLVIYLASVAGLTAAVGRQDYAVSLLATGVAALAALPLRDVLQRQVDRTLYGDRDRPVEVMRRLGRRLEWATDPARAFPAVAETLADALRLPYVGLEVTDELGEPVVVAAHGSRGRSVQAVPLVHGGEPVGQLLLGTRTGEVAFAPSELDLLADLARQVAAAVHAQRLRDDLARSRERLVVAREEERRRLRRDLHDGLGPVLAAVAMRADAAAARLRADPADARRDLAAVADDARAAIDDLRRLVDGLRPPSLDQLGLVGAIQEQADRLGGSQGGPATRVEARPVPLPALPAAVEVAAYRIAVEALTNVVHHAGARSCTVRLHVSDRLTVEVVDDGRGPGPQPGAAPDGDRAGTGLDSMRERAEEVGGSLQVLPGESGGTVVRAILPLRTLSTA